MRLSNQETVMKGKHYLVAGVVLALAIGMMSAASANDPDPNIPNYGWFQLSGGQMTVDLDGLPEEEGNTAKLEVSVPVKSWLSVCFQYERNKFDTDGGTDATLETYYLFPRVAFSPFRNKSFALHAGVGLIDDELFDGSRETGEILNLGARWKPTNKVGLDFNTMSVQVQDAETTVYQVDALISDGEGRHNIVFSYQLRDPEGSSDDSVTQAVLGYRYEFDT